MNTKNTATKWIATGASMALAAGLGVAGLSLAGNSATAAAGDITTVKTNVEYTPAELSGEQTYAYDYDGNVTRIDLDMLNIHLRDKEWHFLNKKDARHGDKATAHGRNFVYTTQETLYKVDEIVRPSKHHNAGFWAPVDADGNIDHRYGAWGVAGKSTAEIGVGRLIYWDGVKWVNQSHFRVDYMKAPQGVTGYKVEAFREPAPSFAAKVSGDYEGNFPSLADSKERQRLVSALAYMFGNADKYNEVNNWVMKNAERRGDAILQLAMGSDLASAAEKVLVYKKKYAAAIDKSFALLYNEGYVTPGEALEGKFTAVEQEKTDEGTKYHLTLSKLGNQFFPITDGKAELKFVDVAKADEKKEEVKEEPKDKETPAESEAPEAEESTAPKAVESTAPEEGAEDAGSRSVVFAEGDEAKTYTLAELNAGIDIVVPEGKKAVLTFASSEVDTPGAFLNRTSLNGTSMVVESGVSAKVTGHIELGADADNAEDKTDSPVVEPIGGNPGDLPDEPKDEEPKDEGTQTDEDNDKGTQTDEEKDDNTVAPTQKPADPQPTKTVTVEKTVAPAPAPAAPVTAQKAPLAKTGASSMLVLLMAAGLATAGTGVVLARRNA